MQVKCAGPNMCGYTVNNSDVDVL